MAIPTAKDIKYWLFLAVFVLVIVMFVRLLIPFIAPLILAAIVVSIFTPVYYFFNRWLPQSVASFVCCVLICVVIFIPFVVIITILANQALGLYASAMDSEFMRNLTHEIDGNTIVAWVNMMLSRLGLDFTISGQEIYQFIGRVGSRFATFLYAQAANITGNFIKLIINFCFMILICYYLFGNGRRLINFFVGLSPLPEGHEVAVLQRLKTTAGAIFFGSFVSGVIQGSVGGITLWIFGFPAPFLWAVVMVILAFLPIVGIGLVFVPCIVITFLGGDIFHAVIMTVIYIASSSITEYIIVPRLEGKRSQMHTVLVFLSVLGGLQLFGIIGVLYGPLIITAFLALYEIYRANYVDEMIMETAANGVVTMTPAMHGEAGENPVGVGVAVAAAAAATAAAAEAVFAGHPPPVEARGGDLPEHFTERVERALANDAGVVHEQVFDDALAEANDIAMGDDIEPEFSAVTGEPVGVADVVPAEAFADQEASDGAVEAEVDGTFGDEALDAAQMAHLENNVAMGSDIEPEYHSDDDAAARDCPGDYPGGTPPAPSDDANGEDGLIWDEARPAHLPFPRAEGAERLMDGDDDDVVSIKDMERADISSFRNLDENRREDKTDKE